MQMVGLGPDHQGLSLVPAQGQVVNDKDFDCKENEKNQWSLWVNVKLQNLAKVGKGVIPPGSQEPKDVRHLPGFNNAMIVCADVANINLWWFKGLAPVYDGMVFFAHGLCYTQGKVIR